MKDYDKATSSASVTAPLTPELEPAPEECVRNEMTALLSDDSMEPPPASTTGPRFKDMAIQCKIDWEFLNIERKALESVGTSSKN